MLSAFLSRIVQAGELTVITPSGKRQCFGPGGAPAVTVRLHHRALYRKLFMNPDLYLGEAYMDGTLTVEEGSLRDFLELCTASAEALDRHPMQRLRQRLGRPLRYLQQYNPLGRSRANVVHHYDLSAELFDLFLDSDRQYSCAYFPDGNESLEQAQEKKKRHITAKLLLQPGMRVLDIGSGWGGLALHIAESAGARVKGITLSEEQLKVAQQRAVRSGLGERARFELLDYRAEREVYDRIVSVGMFEHVGVSHYRGFFRTLKGLLRPNGVALIHAIGRMEPPGQTNPWLRKYIFPGGYCPALSEVLAAVEKAGLWVTDIEVLRLDYAETLREWERRFAANREQVRALYDERFCRMWEFYLSMCEMAFRNGPIMVFQIQLACQRDAVPSHRNYIADWEHALENRAKNEVA